MPSIDCIQELLLVWLYVYAWVHHWRLFGEFSVQCFLLIAEIPVLNNILIIGHSADSLSALKVALYESSISITITTPHLNLPYLTLPYITQSNLLLPYHTKD